MAWRASWPRKTLRLVRPLPRTSFSFAFFTLRSSAGSAGSSWARFEAGDLGAAQPGAQDEVHDRPVPQRPGVPVNGGRLAAAVAAPVELVEALDPVQHVLHCPHLRVGERPGLRG